MPVSSGFTDNQLLYAANLNNAFLNTANVKGEAFTGPVSISGIDIGSGHTNAYNTANAAFIAANNALSGSLTGNVVFTKSTSYYSAQTTLGIGATGITNAAAISLNTQVNIIAVCSAAANSAILPIPPIGSEITIINTGSTNLQLFPPSGHGIDQLQYNANTCVYAGGQYKILLANTNRWFTTSNTVINAFA